MFGELKGDPRWAVAIGCVLVALMATGGNWYARFTAGMSGAPPPPITLPNLYQLLAMVIPGLDAVRVPAALTAGVHVALSVLAGFGAAALIAMVPARFATPVAIALILVAYVDVARPRVIGLTPPVVYQPIKIRPTDDAIRFFQTLAEKGNTGPLLEVRDQGAPSRKEGPQVLLSAYHHRRTSACRATFPPPVISEVRNLSGLLPDPDAIRAIGAMGFTTILVHHPRKVQNRSYVEGFEAATDTGLLQRVHGENLMTAYAINRGDPR
jgi:hypothetical protein